MDDAAPVPARRGLRRLRPISDPEIMRLVSQQDAPEQPPSCTHPPFMDRFTGCIEQCGACLMDIEKDDACDEGFVAVVDCCQPKHTFHVSCIKTWAQRENSCPLCKQRFVQLAVYGANDSLLRVEQIEERNQRPSAQDEFVDGDDEVCQICNSGGDEAALLLCSSRDSNGTYNCPSSYHYYCIGLGSVPDHDWYCPSCVENAQLALHQDEVCPICKTGGDPESMLLCSSRGHNGEYNCKNMCHFYCLGYEGVPEQDWFCLRCSRRRNMVVPLADSSAEESSEELAAPASFLDDMSFEDEDFAESESWTPPAQRRASRVAAGSQRPRAELAAARGSRTPRAARNATQAAHSTAPKAAPKRRGRPRNSPRESASTPGQRLDSAAASVSAPAVTTQRAAPATVSAPAVTAQRAAPATASQRTSRSVSQAGAPSATVAAGAASTTTAVATSNAEPVDQLQTSQRTQKRAHEESAGSVQRQKRRCQSSNSLPASTPTTASGSNQRQFRIGARSGAGAASRVAQPQPLHRKSSDASSSTSSSSSSSSSDSGNSTSTSSEAAKSKPKATSGHDPERSEPFAAEPKVAWTPPSLADIVTGRALAQQLVGRPSHRMRSGNSTGPKPEQPASQLTRPQATVPVPASGVVPMSAVGSAAPSAEDVSASQEKPKCINCANTGVTCMRKPCSCEYGKARAKPATCPAACNKVQTVARKGEDDNSALRAFIERRSSQRLQKAWLKLGREERRLRRRCLQDRLIHEAAQKFQADVHATATGKWATFLGSAKGSSMLSHWIDKKVAAAVEKHAVR